jgi:hypothetical protein
MQGHRHSGAMAPWRINEQVELSFAREMKSDIVVTGIFLGLDLYL